MRTSQQLTEIALADGVANCTADVPVGLPLAKRLTELHGGRIWVESAGPGQGSCFYIALPLEHNVEDEESR